MKENAYPVRLLIALALAVISTSGLVAQTSATATSPNRKDETVQLDPFVVSVNADDGYGSTESASASRFRQKLKDIPQTIVVLSREFLKDIAASEMSDVMPLLGGNVSASTRSQDAFSVRGFGIGEVYLDGMRDTQEWGGGDFVHVQQLEIIKGPSSNLYGNPKGLGGIINRVTKRPKEQQWQQLAVTIGDYNTYFVSADVTGPLTSDKSLLYRLNAVYRTIDYNREFKSLNRLFIVPVLEWRVSRSTKVSFLGEFMRQDFQEDNFIPSIRNAVTGERSITVPDDRRIDEPWGFSRIEKEKFRLIAEHQINQNLTARVAAQQTFINNPIEQVEFLSLAANNRTVNRRAFWLNRWEDDSFLEANLFGRYQTGKVEHSFILAADYFRQHYRSNVRRVALGTIDLIDPVYTTPRPNFPASSAVTNTLGTTVSDGYSGTYQINAYEGRVILIGGVRFSTVDANYANQIGTVPVPFTTDPTTKATSPRWGGIIRPVKSLAFYYQYSEVFQPQVALRLDGSPVAPVTGSSEEFGVRLAFLNDKLNIEAVDFRTVADGLAMRLLPPNNSFFENSGQQTSHGQEYTLTYNDSRLTIRAGWVTDKVRDTTPGTAGLDISGHPKDRAQFIIRYKWPKIGRYGGLSIGGTYSYVSIRPLSLTDLTQKMPAYDVAGLNMSYGLAKGVNLSFAINNLLNNRAVVANAGILWRPLDPRTMRMTISKSW